MFAALRHRNFRLYISGQFVSLIGTWMQQLATSWMVYRLTHAPIWLGISMFSSQIPMFVFGLFGGVYVDRVHRHRLLIWTQSLSAIQALVLAVLTFTHLITLYELIGLNLVLGMINAIDMPARQAFVVEMIGTHREDLPNAIALNSSVMNGTRLIGPAIAGVTISLFGEGVCFLLNAVSYIAVLIALIMMKVERPRRGATYGKVLESLLDGYNGAFKNEVIRSVLILMAFMSIAGLPYMTLFPAMATQVPGGGANTLGMITGFGAAGALVGALYLAKKASPLLGGVVGVSSLIFSAFLIALSFTQQLALMLVFVFFTGMGMLLQMSASNTIIQAVVSDAQRGRIMAFFTFSLLGLAPFGCLLVGFVAQKIGLPHTFLVYGLLSLAGSAVFYKRSARINQKIAARIEVAA